MFGKSRWLLALTMSVALGACASGGAGTGETTEPDGAEVQGREFPPGTAPSRNVWTRSAQIYLEEGQSTDAADERQAAFTRALEQARLSIQNEGGNPLGYYQAGVALLGLQQWREAAQMLDRAEQIYPRYLLETEPRRQNAWVTLYNQAVQALQQGSEDGAIELMETADLVYQNRPEARVNLAILYTNRGEFDSAIQWYNRALETLRGEARDYVSAETRRDWAETESDVVLNLAGVYNRTNRQAEAAELYREYLETNPDDAAVRVQLALLLSAQGQEAEAAAMFDQVLNMQGLDAIDYYQIGIGLFNAGRFEGAVTAFERASQANPYFRDALYNLAQALLARGNELADAGASAAEANAVYERLGRAATAMREIDPFSRTAAVLEASAYQKLAENTSGATSTEWRNRLVRVLEGIENLPIDVTNVALSQTGTGRYAITGTVENLSLNAGTPIVLRFSVLGANGQAAATQEVTVQAPAREQTATFRAEFEVTGEIAGWRYERVN